MGLQQGFATGGMGSDRHFAWQRSSGTECPLWVKSGHHETLNPRPLYPQKRTSVERAAMSALCQKQTHALQQNDLNR